MSNESICRACLGETSNMVSLFKPYRDHSIAYFVTSLTGIHITEEENDLPDKICSLCFDLFELVINFKTKFKDSDKYLKSLQKTQDFSTQPLEHLVKEEPDEMKLENSIHQCDFLYFNDIYNDTFNHEDQNEEISSCPITESSIVTNLQCHDCGDLFKSKCKLRVHWKKVHKPEILTCKLCMKIFSSYPILKKHSQKQCIDVKHTYVEGTGKNRMYCCKYCDVKYKQYSSMKIHMVKHTKVRGYSCDLCGKTFTQWSGVYGHKEMVHNIIRVEMTCVHCGKHVKGRNSCYQHLQTHSNERYQCDICKAFFKLKSGLRVHIKRHLYGDKRVPVTCEICGKLYTSNTGLNLHKKLVHKINGSLFRCKICNYQNKNPYSIQKHEKKHYDSNQFKCSDCHQFYNSEKRLAAHFELVHGPKTHMCLFCDRGFKKRLTVLNHQEKTHPEKLKSHEGSTYKIVRSTYTRKPKKK